MENLLSQLQRLRLVPVISLKDASLGNDLASALVEGGLPIAEVTFRTAAAESVMQAMVARGDLLVAAGTVLTEEQASRARDTGAAFAVSPGCDPRVVNHCQKIGLPIIPGVATPSDVCAALSFGLNTLKFFPAECYGGISTLTALAAPFKDVRFIPTGGIGPKNLPAYLALSQVIACGGSWMIHSSLYSGGDFTSVRDAVANAVAIANAVQKKIPAE